MSKYLKFERLLDKQCEDFIRFLVSENVNFSLVCEICNVSFEPPLPQDILSNFKPLSLFVLAGYTFESLTFCKNGIGFEAGFGSDNIGSFVQIEFRHILQLIMTNQKNKDTLIFSRIDSLELFEDEERMKQDHLEQSMKAILSNPHNKKFFN